jgi:hypothetical protein
VLHIFSVYFDHNYLPQALLMLQSLRRFDSDTPVYAIALSEPCEAALADLALPGVTVIPLRRLEAAYPELLRLKPQRSSIEYIFTLKPFLPLYLFATTTAERVTYLDSDLCFYADPRLVLDLIGPAAIAITPHRFSPAHLGNTHYGRFNAGWFSVRRDAEGLACLQRYRDDCVGWCHDRVEDGKFAEQGYLDAWPERYESLAIITHKGVNLALWNVDNYRLEERDGAVAVDGEALIFYHFHGIRLQADGSFALWLPTRHSAEDGVAMRRLYRPYVARLIQKRIELHRRFPAVAAAERRLRYLDEPAPSAVVEARLEEDAVARVLVAEIAACQPDGASSVDHAPLNAALAAACGPRRRISVLDWRGGVGVARIAASRAAPALLLDWHVFDSLSLCDHGAAVHPEVRFWTDPAAFEGRRFDLVRVTGALGGESDWAATLRRLRRHCGRALLLDRMPLTAGSSCAAEYRTASPPAGVGRGDWILNEIELLAALAAAGFTLVQSWTLGIPLDSPPRLVSLLCTAPALGLAGPLFRAA